MWGRFVLTAALLPLTMAAYSPFPSPATPTRIISTATDNAKSIKASAGQLYGLVVVNTTETIAYLKFYDTASTPTCGTTTVAFTLPIPAGSAGAPLTPSFPVSGVTFTNGIGLCLTGGGAESDDTQATAGVFITVLWN